MTTIRVPAQGTLEHDVILHTLASHAIPGAEVVDVHSGRYSRCLVIDQAPYRIDLTIDATGVTVGVDSSDANVLSRLSSVVTDWFELEAALTDITACLNDDPTLGPLVRARPGLRITGHPDGFEATIMTVLGQQVSLAATRTFGGRLVAALGALHGDLAIFPTPERILAEPADRLRARIGITNARADTIRAVAALFASGFRFDRSVDPDEARAQLLALRGVGAWTVDYLSLRVLGATDIFPASDAVLRRALGGIDARAAERSSQMWRPYRSYATVHLWAHAAGRAS